MAVMIPEVPNDFTPASQEDLMFQALQELPDEYYVFHSLRMVTIQSDTLHESETDFVVYNRKKGLLCIEAKAGHVRYEHGSWLYGNGVRMHNGGPFKQAETNKWNLLHYLESSGHRDLSGKCKFLHAVWFPSVDNEELHSLIFPPEADKGLVLTTECLKDPLPTIDRIFSIELPNGVTTNLSAREHEVLLQEVLCPQFNVFPNVSFEDNLKKIVFHRLLVEQSNVLNFLEEQRTAVINGAAGTGKTMIAVEKARRHSTQGESVLFLCYNVKLKTFLEQTYPLPNVDYFTIAGLACKLCRTATPDYSKLKELLEGMFFSGQFPYNHVIVDEGQDFGADGLYETDILSLLQLIVSNDSRDHGSFYVFYDKLQLIQGKEIPAFLNDADCKITLYRNCRNTESIATTSLRPLSERKPKLKEGCIRGRPAKIRFCESDEEVLTQLDEATKELLADGYKDIVVLSCKTEQRGILSQCTQNGLYQNRYLATTCRKFKGLEADCIILTDVDRSTFSGQDVLLYYVGASRARLRLEIIIKMSDTDCEEVLRNKFKVNRRIRHAKRDLTSALNAVVQ